jgi:hypothetical protein
VHEAIGSPVLGVARLLACALLLAAGGAGAETYRVLEGELALGGEAERLTGALEVSPFAVQPIPSGPEVLPPEPGEIPFRRPESLRVDGFALQAGAQDLAAHPPLEYLGRTPTAYLQIADQLLLNRDTGAVDLLRLRAGGEIVAADEEQVTFRFLEFRSDVADGGHVEGELADSGLPGRVVLHGTLHEVDQTFLVDQCPIVIVPPDPPPPQGGVIISFPAFDIGGSVAIGSVTGTLGGSIGGGGYQPPDVADRLLQLAPDLAAPVPSPADRVLAGDLDVSTPGFGTLSQPPTLEDLGITAPEGAEVTLAQGEVTVTSAGDLFVAGGPIDIPGLTKLSLVAGHGIYVEGNLSLPPGVGLSLTAGVEVVVDGTLLPGDPPGEISVDVESGPTGFPLCLGLRALLPPLTREVGSFSLVAAVTHTVDVSVRARRVLPWRQRPLAVAVLGSEDLDASEVVPESLRLGSGGAEALRTRLRDVDGDGRRDLVARFDVGEAGIALGDDEVCLVGELADASAIAGCDAIVTWPRRLRRQAAD